MDTIGRNFRISVFGESHGSGIGVVLDGVPPGIDLSYDDFISDIARRKSGAAGTTSRREDDSPEILSGVHAGHTTGAPLAVLFRNNDTRSSDYSLFREIPRPGHADFVAGVKWNDFNDPRGGGHFSGRVTLALVAAGVVARKVLSEAGITVSAGLTEVGGVPYSKVSDMKPGECDPSEIWNDIIKKAVLEGDSLGGIVECRAENVPVGLGEPFFDSVESVISHMVFSIPGVRGIEFGDGFKSAAMKGSVHNDPLESASGESSRNGAGGVNGGISNGNPIVFRVAFKPTSSIRKEQYTYNFTSGKISSLEIPGRHDVCFALRTPVIVEAATAIVITDLLLTSDLYKR